MNYVLEITDTAIMDGIEAFLWYESLVTGLGIEFSESLESFYEKLLLNPYSHSYFDGTTRHGVLDRFPYTVVYDVFNEVIVIYSVFMEKQDPEKKRVK